MHGFLTKYNLKEDMDFEIDLKEVMDFEMALILQWSFGNNKVSNTNCWI